jgi:hypothetical protein
MEVGVGRFLAPDPVRIVDVANGEVNPAILSDPQRLNVYGYGLNNPYRYVDPDGEFAVAGVVLAAAALLAMNSDIANAPAVGNATYTSNGAAGIVADGAIGGAFGYVGGKILGKFISEFASKNVIGFAQGTGKTAFTPNRLQHASRHLTDSGLLPNWSKATGQKFTDLGTNILENPTATFDHVLRGGQKVKGFMGKVDGQNVAVMVYKEGKFQGQVATAVVPSPTQMTNWGMLP